MTRFRRWLVRWLYADLVAEMHRRSREGSKTFARDMNALAGSDETVVSKLQRDGIL